MNTARNETAGSIAELAALIGLTNANLDMKDHFPKDVLAGTGCGIFVGVGGGVHVSAGSGNLEEVTSSRLHLKGSFSYPGYQGSAELEIELLGSGRARLRMPALASDWLKANAWKQDGDLFYQVTDAPIAGAVIKQIYAEAGLFSGSYVEFHVKAGEYYEVKYWFHKN